MKTTIGTYDAETRTVPVIFEQGDVKHSRSVNACLDVNGKYDRAATKDRVADVALGVTQKILVGAITAAAVPAA